jgi:hypothetical protein
MIVIATAACSPAATSAHRYKRALKALESHGEYCSGKEVWVPLSGRAPGQGRLGEDEAQLRGHAFGVH